MMNLDQSKNFDQSTDVESRVVQSVPDYRGTLVVILSNSGNDKLVWWFHGEKVCSSDASVDCIQPRSSDTFYTCIDR